ncbi:MAG: ABC transporter ATP-binding protein [Verrucomicrobiales bacterium]|jgi:phospholipid/cholesterol/gamma-HCH transport system ATP-binding protein|nr:ABC transporter ATP-binding protein [Verrucomicrobiales bacterium]
MDAILEIRDLRKALNGHPVLRGVNLSVRAGENVVIIGRSGGGKSVLLRHITGLMQPDAGAVIFGGVNLSALGEEALNPYRRDIGMLFQNGALFDSLTVGENLAFPLRERGALGAREIAHRVREALDIVGLPGHHDQLPAELSGGMKKRVALARAIISRPALMLYDEPTTGLDPIVADSINKLIVRLGARLHMSNIVVTHDMVSACHIADRVCQLHEGKIYYTGTPAEIQTSADPVVQKFVKGISEPQDAIV